MEPEISIKIFTRFSKLSDYGREPEAGLKPFAEAEDVTVERFETGPKIAGPADVIERMSVSYGHAGGASCLANLMAGWKHKYPESRFVLNVGNVDNLDNPLVASVLKWMLDAGGSGRSRLGDVSVISKERR